MAKLTDEIKNKILADFHVGKSQNELVKIHGVSKGTINKLCKGLSAKYKEKVTTVSMIKKELSNENDHQVTAFNEAVNEQTRRLNLVFGASEKLLQRTQQLISSNKTIEKVNVGDGIQSFQERELNSIDLKNLADTVDKASITLGVNQRHASSQVTVNNTNAQQNNESISFEDFYKNET